MEETNIYQPTDEPETAKLFSDVASSHLRVADGNSTSGRLAPEVWTRV